LGDLVSWQKFGEGTSADTLSSFAGESKETEVVFDWTGDVFGSRLNVSDSAGFPIQ
jgi:hypothetical protein